jgi:hypothetical protein
MAYTYKVILDLKNRASKLAREQNVPRHAALDTAARLGGFENYAHALKHLPTEISTPLFSVDVRQRWFERETRRNGVASINLNLTAALDEIVKAHHLVAALGGCSLDDPQTLSCNGSMRDREESLGDVARVARTLQFMDATGLKPSRAHKCYPRGDWQNRPPIADHDSCWYDPEARTYILMTQPYPGREARRREDHLAWERRHGWATIQSRWGSLYGHGTELFLLCPEAYASTLRTKASKLEDAPRAVLDTDVSSGDDAKDRSTSGHLSASQVN